MLGQGAEVLLALAQGAGRLLLVRGVVDHRDEGVAAGEAGGLDVHVHRVSRPVLAAVPGFEPSAGCLAARQPRQQGPEPGGVKLRLEVERRQSAELVVGVAKIGASPAIDPEEPKVVGRENVDLAQGRLDHPAEALRQFIGASELLDGWADGGEADEDQGRNQQSDQLDGEQVPRWGCGVADQGDEGDDPTDRHQSDGRRDRHPGCGPAGDPDQPQGHDHGRQLEGDRRHEDEERHRSSSRRCPSRPRRPRCRGDPTAMNR